MTLLRRALEWPHAVLMLVSICISGVALAADNTDVVLLKNGDRLTGEIRRMDHGQLELKAAALGTIYIEWPAVAGVASNAPFAVDELSGRRYYGALAFADDGVAVINGDQRIELPLAQVSLLGPVRDSFLGRVRGSTSVGVNYGKSTSIKAGSFRFDAEYNGRKSLASLSSSVDVNSSPESGTSQRMLVNYSQRFFLEGTRFWSVLSSFERIQELGIDGRLQVGLAVGRSLIRNTDSDFVGYLGAVVNEEATKGTGASQSAVEGVAGLDWRVYRFGSRDTTLTSTFLVYPSVTDFGRVRSRLDLTLTRKFTNSFTLNFSVYDDFDNRPPGTNSLRNDYGIVTSLGYTF